MSTVLINYSEITLKGKNRPYFERILKENIQKSTNKYGLRIKKMEKDLGNISLIISHHLNLLEIGFKEQQQKDTSKD